MRAIEAADWDLSGAEFNPPIVQACPHGVNEVEILSFGMVGDEHVGHAEDHGALAFGVAGRKPLRWGPEGQVVLRWNIRGWDHVTSASIRIFRRGSLRPISQVVVAEAAGTFDTAGLAEALRLNEEAQAQLPGNAFSPLAGPYLARLRIEAVQASTRVITATRRSYFDIVPLAVIGAGAAGLRAAERLLENANDAVLLIEARDRIGGRAHSVMSAPGHVIDLGCQWLHRANINPWVTRGGDNFPHDQIELELDAGAAVAEDAEVSKLVSDAIKSCTAMETLQQALLRVASATALNGANQAMLEQVAPVVVAQLEVLLEQAMAAYVPAEDTARARTLIRAQLVRSAQYRGAANQAALGVELERRMALPWHQDDALTTQMRTGERSRQSVAIRDGHRAALTEAACVPLLAARDVQAEQARAALLARPALRLTLGMECELEESIEATGFTTVGRADNQTPADPVPAPGEVAGLALVIPPAAEQEATGRPDMNYMPVEGFGQRMIDFGNAMAAANLARLRLMRSSELRAIRVAGDYLMLEVLSGDVTRTLAVRGAVLALPTPIVPGLECVPPLPQPVLDAFAHLPLGHYKKIVLHLVPGSELQRHLAGRRPAEDDGEGEGDDDGEVADGGDDQGAVAPADDVAVPVIDALPVGGAQADHGAQADPDAAGGDEGEQDGGDDDAPPEGQVTDISLFTVHLDVVWKLVYRHDKNLVIAFCGGARARELDINEDLAAVATVALAALAHATGQSLDDVVRPGYSGEVQTSRWSADAERFSGGAYSYTAPGGVGARGLLRRAVVHDRIVFAGEALWLEEHGTAHGAWFSGEMAAGLLRGQIG